MMEIVTSGIVITAAWVIAFTDKDPKAFALALAVGTAWALILAYFTAVDFKKRRSTMPECKIPGKVREIDGSSVYLEFGSTQATMEFSSKGNMARKLKLKEGQKVVVTIATLEK